METIESHLGDIWAVGEKFVLLHADHEKGANERLMGFMRDQWLADPSWRPNITYTDPPWTPGIAKGFRRMAGVGQILRPDGSLGVPLDMIITLIGRAALEAKGDVYIEFGYQYEGLLVDVMRELGAAQVDRWDITYAYGKNRCVLVQFAADGVEPARSEPSAQGMDDRKTPTWAMERSSDPGAWVYEPCMGLGTTARCAMDMDRRVCGVELRPQAVDRTLRMVSRKLKCEPQKVGEV